MADFLKVVQFQTVFLLTLNIRLAGIPAKLLIWAFLPSSAPVTASAWAEMVLVPPNSYSLTSEIEIFGLQWSLEVKGKGVLLNE